jgi:hypothetical protein
MGNVPVGERAAGARAEDEVGISAAAGSLLGGQLIDEDGRHRREERHDARTRGGLQKRNPAGRPVAAGWL